MMAGPETQMFKRELQGIGSRAAKARADDFQRHIFPAGCLSVKRHLILVGPEPRDGIVRGRSVEHVACDERSLILGIAPSLEPDAAMTVERMGERAAIAGGEYAGIAGAQILIHANAVFDVEPGGS